MSNNESSTPSHAPEVPAARMPVWRKLLGHRLVTNSGIYVFGQVLQKAFAFLLIPLYARFLTPDDYGITGTLAAYGAVLSALLVLGLHGSASKHYFDHVHNRAELESYLFSIISFQVVVPGLAILALNVWGEQLWGLCSSERIAFDPFVRLMVWTVYLNALLQIPFSVYQSEQRAGTYVGMQLLLFLLGFLGCLVLVIGLRQGAKGVLTSQLLSTLVLVVIVYLSFFRGRFPRPIRWRHVRAGLLFGLPLLPHILGGMVMSIADRMILERCVPLAEVGLYTMAVTLGMALGFVATGINQAWAPYYLKLVKEDPQAPRKVQRVVSLYLPALGGLCLVGSLFSAELIRLILPPAYYGAAPYVGPILLGNFFCGLYYFAVLPLFAREKTKWLALTTALTAAGDVVLNIWLVPRAGAQAAAWIFALANATLLLAVFVISRRYDTTRFPLLKYGVVVTLLCGAIVLAGLADCAWYLRLAFLFLFAAISYPLLMEPNIRTLAAEGIRPGLLGTECRDSRAGT